MSIVRQDAWTDQEDRTLAETVLEQIRVGGTQLIAFGLVGQKLKRTSAACGFRWNSAIRKLYAKEIEEAKKVRKGNKGKLHKSVRVIREGDANVGEAKRHKGRPRTKEITLLELLHNLKKQVELLEQFAMSENERPRLSERCALLIQEVNALKAENEQLKIELDLIEKDYKAFMSVMERARLLTLKENCKE